MTVRALYRVNFDVCQRSRPGGDAVKLAAYNGCTRLSHGGKTYDFRHKRSEHVAGFMMLPAGVPADRFRAPGELWRAAEAAENRGNSQTARMLLLTIPREVPEDHRAAFSRFCVEPLVDAGMAATVDVHAPSARDGGEQPHAHVLLTMREFTDDGSDFAATKKLGREWNRQFTENRGRAMRERLADRMNLWFQESGLECRVDHRTNVEIDGPAATPPEPQVSRAAVEESKRKPGKPIAEIVNLDAHRRQRRAVEELDISIASAQLRITEITAARASRRAKENSQRSKVMSSTKQGKAPWMQQQDGAAGLSPELLASAQRSYEKWKAGQLKRGRDEGEIFAFETYVDYVQDRRTKDDSRPRREQNKDVAFEASPSPAPEPGPNLDPAVTGWTRRKRFLANLLAEHYDAGELDTSVADRIKRIKLDRDARTATVYLNDGSHFIDHGDRIQFQGKISQPSADEIAAAAARHGWTSVELTGTPEFREQTAIALAMREPPIQHNHELSHAAVAKLAQMIADREAARPVTNAIKQTTLEPTNAAHPVSDSIAPRAVPDDSDATNLASDSGARVAGSAGVSAPAINVPVHAVGGLSVLANHAAAAGKPLEIATHQDARRLAVERWFVADNERIDSLLDMRPKSVSEKALRIERGRDDDREAARLVNLAVDAEAAAAKTKAARSMFSPASRRADDAAQGALTSARYRVESWNRDANDRHRNTVEFVQNATLARRREQQQFDNRADVKLAKQERAENTAMFDRMQSDTAFARRVVEQGPQAARQFLRQEEAERIRAQELQAQRQDERNNIKPF